MHACFYYIKHFEIDLVESQKLLPIYLRQQNDRCISHIKHVVKEVIIYMLQVIFLLWGGGEGAEDYTLRGLSLLYFPTTRTLACAILVY